MSYCRLSDDSDVYIYANSYGINCCSCALGPPDFEAQTADLMLAHVELHIRAGHKVPDRAITRLFREECERDK